MSINFCVLLGGSSARYFIVRRHHQQPEQIVAAGAVLRGIHVRVLATFFLPRLARSGGGLHNIAWSNNPSDLCDPVSTNI